MYYYQLSANNATIVSTCNEGFARIKARTLMSKTIVLSVLPEWKVKKFKPKFNAKAR